jgi:hypothetical protein
MIRAGREELIKQLIRAVYEARKGEVLAFNYELLDDFEMRGKFTRLMDEIGLGHLNLGSYMIESMYEDNISHMFLQRTKAVVRVYLIEGFNFASKDIGSASDPYLVLKNGKRVYNERENYQLDTCNP